MSDSGGMVCPMCGYRKCTKICIDKMLNSGGFGDYQGMYRTSNGVSDEQRFCPKCWSVFDYFTGKTIRHDEGILLPVVPLKRKRSPQVEYDPIYDPEHCHEV